MAKVTTREKPAGSLWRLKHKAPGLTIIAGLGALHCIPAAALLAKSPDWRDHLELLLNPLIYVVVVFCAAFGLILCAQSASSSTLRYFRDFNIWKGLACILLAPAQSFWIQLFRNLHYSLDTANPFGSLLFPHAVIALLSLLPAIAVCVQKVWRIKATRECSRATKSPQTPDGLIPNILWIRLYFRGNGADPLGRTLSTFVGVAYLGFVYLTIASLIVPRSMNVNTHGKIVSANTIMVMYTSRNSSRRSQYCQIELKTDQGTSRFALAECLPCMKVIGTPVSVIHNPIDYFSRRSNSAQCDVPHASPQAQ